MYELNPSNTRQHPILLPPGGAKLYEKLGPVDILELRRKVWKICHPTTSVLINIGQTNSLIPHCALALTGDTKSRAQAADNQKNLSKPGEGR
jgi:hypothetical protein